MKRQLIALSQRYVTALEKHVKQSPGVGLQAARGLGRQAAAIGLETLDVARIHQKALATLQVPDSRDGIIKRAQSFFNEAITPIERTHRSALQANLHMAQLDKKLERRTVALAVANRSLKQGIAQRKAAENAFKKSGAHSEKLLKESRRLQKHLQRLAHRILSAQEDKRKKISQDLQDEIAQTLLGIDVRLLTVRRQAGLNEKRFKNEIANTQRLVNMSVKTIERFARGFGNHHET